MVDHAVRGSNGTYTYGGDHGEWAHDGNFCVDGIFYPDRTPSTDAKIVKFVYRPVRISHVEGNRYEIFNTMAFTDSSKLTFRFAFSNGREITPQISVPPMTKAVIDLPGCEDDCDSVTVTALRDGEEVSQEQILFRQPQCLVTAAKGELPDGISLCDGVVSVSKDGRTMAASDPYTILFRVPTDNDRDFLMNTAMDDYLPQKEEIVHTRITQNQIQVKTKITCRKQVFVCTDTYESCPEGILVTSRLQCIKGGGKLPRFGKAFRLDSAFDQVEYHGRNGESYRDMKDHTQIETVSCRVADMTEPNIKPQESGNRCDCTYVTLSDGETAFIIRAVEQAFELGVKPYSDRELLKMRHREDEVRTGTYVTVSAFQMGIGTGSCGPATRKEYCFDAKNEYVLKFVIQ